MNQAGLAAGVYEGTITATFSSGPPQEVEVLLIVATEVGALRTQAGLPRAAQCAPSGLQLLSTTIGSGLSLPVSFPRVLTALVVDDCGSGVDNATLVAGVEGLNIPLRGLGTGFYSGTWVPVRRGCRGGDHLCRAASHLCPGAAVLYGFDSGRAGRGEFAGVVCRRGGGRGRLHQAAAAVSRRHRFPVWRALRHGEQFRHSATAGAGTGRGERAHWRPGRAAVFRQPGAD